MNKQKAVIEFYNKNQGEYTIPMDFFFKEYNNLRIYHYETDQYFDIGFYEWLFNPKYKVFETLSDIIDVSFDPDDGIGKIISKEQPKEIIDYLYNQIKDGK